MSCTNIDSQFRSINTANQIPQNPETFVDIGHVAKKYQISLRTLRFYEESGLLQPKRKGMKRLYCQNDCRRLEEILKGRQFGFSIAQIGQLIQKGEKLDLAIETTLSLEEIKSKIETLERQRDDVSKCIGALRIAYEKAHTTDMQEG